MQRAFRLTLLLAVAWAAIALTGSALGAASKDSGFTPDLWASNFDRLIGLQSFELAVGANEVATAKASIYVARGDVMSLPGGAVGDDIGDVAATIRLGAAFGNAIVTLPGDVKVVNPASFVVNQCSPGTHQAVWLLVVQSPSGPPLEVPMYVDPAAAAEAGLGSYKLQVCLPSPYVPENQGGARFGAKLVRATVSVENFRKAVRGRWTAFVTPYLEGTKVPNARGTVETQSVVSQAKISRLVNRRIVLKRNRFSTRPRKRYFAKISGVVKQNGKGTRATVALYAVGKKKLKQVATKKSKRSGKFRFKVRLKKTTRFVVAARKAPGHQRPPRCVPDVGGLPCTSVSTSGFLTIKATKKFRVPRGS